MASRAIRRALEQGDDLRLEVRVLGPERRHDLVAVRFVLAVDCGVVISVLDAFVHARGDIVGGNELLHGQAGQLPFVFQRFGVEAVRTIEAVSPNLPPAAPKNFSARYRARSLFNNKYDAILSWKATNKEPDLAGYQIYATAQFWDDLVSVRKPD